MKDLEKIVLKELLEARNKPPALLLWAFENNKFSEEEIRRLANTYDIALACMPKEMRRQWIDVVSSIDNTRNFSELPAIVENMLRLHGDIEECELEGFSLKFRVLKADSSDCVDSRRECIGRMILSFKKHCNYVPYILEKCWVDLFELKLLETPIYYRIENYRFEVPISEDGIIPFMKAWYQKSLDINLSERAVNYFQMSRILEK